MSKLTLTPDQQKAKDTILQFLGNENQRSFVIYGAAGTGKSQLTRSILDEIRTAYSIAGVAPTHKARKTLDRFLNKNAFITVKTMTVASLLNKLRGHSYIGTKRYKGGADTKMNDFDIYFIDEVSMITDEDYNKILHFAELFKKKIIFIGDKYQIPNPSQQYIKNKDNTYSKKDSIAFDSKDKIELTTIVRQSKDNPLVDIYLKIREGLINDKPITFIKKSKPGIIFYDNQEKWYNHIKNFYRELDLKNIHNTRILAYTNDSVRNHNRIVRDLFDYPLNIPAPGELLMGYNTIGWPDPVVENSQDYYLISITPTDSHSIERYNNLVGYILVLQEVESDKTSCVFMPDLTSICNQNMLKQLLERSDAVNKKFSTKEDFKKYMKMKNQMVFMENIYRFNTEILPEPQFRTSHPLLFKPVTDIIDENEDERVLKDNKLAKDIKNRYPDLINKRYEDDKILTESEKISDSFQVIEKDLDYGYAITVHKSQASSFDTVFIDEADIEKIKDCWSYKLDATIKGFKEQNQLKYVAYTRPRKEAIVYFRESI